MPIFFIPKNRSTQTVTNAQYMNSDQILPDIAIKNCANLGEIASKELH